MASVSLVMQFLRCCRCPAAV